MAKQLAINGGKKTVSLDQTVALRWPRFSKEDFEAVKTKMRKSLKCNMSAILVVFIIPIAAASVNRQENGGGWKAGVASVVITPDQPMWMAGYGSRQHVSEGTLHDLWAKVLCLEDSDGNRAVLIATDLEGFPKPMSDRIRDRLEAKYRLGRSQIILNSSHTHTAPVLKDSPMMYLQIQAEDYDNELDKIKKYSDKLEDQIVNLVGRALKSMEPARLHARSGVTRFQVNRRSNKESTLHLQTELLGPNDYAVPVIRVTDKNGEIMAIVFSYACHPTVLGFYNWSGDYPGFAQMELEQMHPGATALFFQGAGADQNPLPRRTVPLAQQYGRELAAAVDRVLAEEMPELQPELTTVYSEIELPLNPPPDKTELLKLAEESSGYKTRWAKDMLDKIERGEQLIRSYPYPVQVWRLGDQPIMCLGGEVVIEYALELKRIFGHRIFVLGYSNDMMAYIPSLKILSEGGYEGLSSQMVFELPGAWTTEIESLIIREMISLAGQAGVPLQTIITEE